MHGMLHPAGHAAPRLATLLHDPLWPRWTALVTLGEAVGFGAPVLAGVGAWAAGAPEPAVLALAVAGGLFEGAALGFAQHLALRDTLPALPRCSWVLATSLSAGIAWAAGVTAGALAGNVPVVAAVLAWVLAAMVILPSLGGAQALVLRGHIERPWRWALINAGAWLVALIPSFVGPALVPSGAPAAAWVGAGVGSGLAMAIIAAALTGIGAVHLFANGGSRAAR